MTGFIRGWALGMAWAGALAAAPFVEYQTDFDPPAFLAPYALSGQGGWIHYPESALVCSQIVSNAFPSEGQQALIGFAPPTDESVWSASSYRPLSEDPVAAGRPVILFQVRMAVIDSSNGLRDAFRWSVFNRRDGGQRLFSLDFDNQTKVISWIRDDGRFVDTGWRMNPEENDYSLELAMDFDANLCSASLNGLMIITNATLTTLGLDRTLGDISAVWVRSPENPEYGDNYMLFDRFRIISDEAFPSSPELQPLQFLDEGGFLVRLHGENERRYAMEATSDLSNWIILATNKVTDTSVLFLDPTASVESPPRFYRARALWP